MRTTRWIRGAVAGMLVAVTFGAGHAEAGTRISGGTAEQQAMGEWAIGRFEAAGLSLPSLEIQFHEDRSACRDRAGYYIDGVASVCGIHTDRLAHRLILHEMAHGWAEANVTGDLRARFLELRGLRTWNDQDADWNERGFEHAADIMSWALCDQGTGLHAPSIPDNSLDQLTVAYELLTGNPLPDLSLQLR
jgi:hypothetical protein